MAATTNTSDKLNKSKENMVEINNLIKKFGKFTALNGINLEVNSGEVLAFLGPNGAGKTTTIRVLLGILRATSGEVKLFGQDAWANAVELHKRITFVPGDVNLWSNLTGGEVIDLFMALRKGGKPDHKRREEYIQRFELDPSKKCRTYSKGNRQKVALVAALSSDAELFVLDEPTSGLDPLMEKVFQDCILEIKAQGKSVLLSSHIISEVEKLADKISIIREGVVVEKGSMADISHKLAGKSLEDFFLSKYEGVQ
ncbi:MAG: ABC transporter ATP-binding protein [Oscillospiraceae bacterium]|nr:ABC transporter ATP-binding protein [Oscillospiraceae bacterium]